MRRATWGARGTRSHLAGASLLACMSFAAAAGGQEPTAGPGGGLAETGQKLSNPIADVWALFARFQVGFADGQVNSGDSKVGGEMIFQPILPVPLYGKRAKRWSFITRPTIPVLFSEAVPTGLNRFDRKAGLGDIQLPTVIAPPAGNWLLGAGPAVLFPTASDDDFGRQQWGIGPAAVVGYRTKAATFGVFGQAYFGVGSHGVGSNAEPPPGERDAQFLQLLYFAWFNLPDAWQWGMSPTITYDARATTDNKWNVPVALQVAKIARVGKLPVKFQFGVEYSVVSEKVYGQQARLVLEVIPVIRPLIRRPILGQ